MGPGSRHRPDSLRSFMQHGLCRGRSPAFHFVSILAVRNLSPERRAIWRRTFEHLVFSGGDEALAHLSERERGLQGKPDPQKAEMIRNFVAQMLVGRGR
jgi:hypothetical protein